MPKGIVNMCIHRNTSLCMYFFRAMKCPRGEKFKIAKIYPFNYRIILIKYTLTFWVAIFLNGIEHSIDFLSASVMW